MEVVTGKWKKLRKYFKICASAKHYSGNKIK